jgi:hypothetical protein
LVPSRRRSSLAGRPTGRRRPHARRAVAGRWRQRGPTPGPPCYSGRSSRSSGPITRATARLVTAGYQRQLALKRWMGIVKRKRCMRVAGSHMVRSQVNAT